MSSVEGEGVYGAGTYGASTYGTAAPTGPPVIGPETGPEVGDIKTRYYSDSVYPTQLTRSLGINDILVTVQSTQGYPRVPFCLTIDRTAINQEVVLVNAIENNSQFYVTRGFNSVPFPHSINAVVEHDIMALDYLEANVHQNDMTRDDHIAIMRADGARHNLSERHQVGVTIPVGVPSDSALFDAQTLGTSTYVAAADHVHGRETTETLVSAYFPIGITLLYPAVTTFATLPAEELEEILDGLATTPPYGNSLGTVATTVLTKLSAPMGWLLCDGTYYSKDIFPLLYAVIGNTYGASDTTFAVPSIQPDLITATNTQGYVTSSYKGEGFNDHGGMCWIIKCDGNYIYPSQTLYPGATTFPS